MAFETLSEGMQFVATKSLAYMRHRFGNNGVKIEIGIDRSIAWRPTFYLKQSSVKILAVEVDDNLYPNSLKGAAQDVRHFLAPICVYQACSLEAYQRDPRQENINRLRSHGFGIITVADNGDVVMQHMAVPLSQCITPDEMSSELRDLPTAVKVAFRGAYDVYLTNEGQGLQEAGQIVEAIVAGLARAANKANVVTKGTLGKSLADQIDDLYATNVFKEHRAALGSARTFIKEFRNVASHPSKTRQAAAEKIRKCRKGFLEGISTAHKLSLVAHQLKYKLRLQG